MSLSETTMRSFGEYKSFRLSIPSPTILHIELLTTSTNSMTKQFWDDLIELFTKIKNDKNIRVVIFSSANTEIFTSGLDLNDHSELIHLSNVESDVGRKSIELSKYIEKYQSAFTLLQEIPQPVIMCIDQKCIGGGVNMITAADIRICTKQAYFQVAEINIGMVADVGILQRGVKIGLNDSSLRYYCYTGEMFKSAEAVSMGLVSDVFNNKEDMVNFAIELANKIASKSPLAISHIKKTLNYSRDHSIQEGLNYVRMINSALFQSSDIGQSVKSMKSKQKPIYSNL